MATHLEPAELASLSLPPAFVPGFLIIQCYSRVKFPESVDEFGSVSSRECHDTPATLTRTETQQASEHAQKRIERGLERDPPSLRQRPCVESSRAAWYTDQHRSPNGMNARFVSRDVTKNCGGFFGPEPGGSNKLPSSAG